MQSIASHVAATADLILVRGKFMEPETSMITSSADSRPVAVLPVPVADTLTSASTRVAPAARNSF